MSTVESFFGPENLTILDRILLGFTAVFLLAHAVACYFSMHTDGVLATIAFNLLLILVSTIVTIVIIVRVGVMMIFNRFRQGWLVSIALLACVTLLASYLPLGRPAIFYALDQLRFHMGEDIYLAEVDRSESSPKFVVLDWGGSEFVAWRTRYFLVFDENISIARGLAAPMDMPLPNENTRCDTSARPLRGSFYSVTVYCEPI